MNESIHKLVYPEEKREEKPKWFSVLELDLGRERELEWLGKRMNGRMEDD